MGRPKIRNIEMTPSAEAFLSGAEPEVSPVKEIGEKTMGRPRQAAAKKAAPQKAAPKKAVKTLSDTAPVAQSSSERGPEKKWATKFKLSTIELIEERFHAYYTPEKGRLSKRDIVEILLVDALKDDARVLKLLGKPPGQ